MENNTIHGKNICSCSHEILHELEEDNQEHSLTNIISRNEISSGFVKKFVHSKTALEILDSMREVLSDLSVNPSYEGYRSSEFLSYLSIFVTDPIADKTALAFKITSIICLMESPLVSTYLLVPLTKAMAFRIYGSDKMQLEIILRCLENISIHPMSHRVLLKIEVYLVNIMNPLITFFSVTRESLLIGWRIAVNMSAHPYTADAFKIKYWAPLVRVKLDDEAIEFRRIGFLTNMYQAKEYFSAHSLPLCCQGMIEYLTEDLVLGKFHCLYTKVFEAPHMYSCVDRLRQTIDFLEENLTFQKRPIPCKELSIPAAVNIKGYMDTELNQFEPTEQQNNCGDNWTVYTTYMHKDGAGNFYNQLDTGIRFSYEKTYAIHPINTTSPNVYKHIRVNTSTHLDDDIVDEYNKVSCCLLDKMPPFFPWLLTRERALKDGAGSNQLNAPIRATQMIYDHDKFVSIDLTVSELRDLVMQRDRLKTAMARSPDLKNELMEMMNDTVSRVELVCSDYRGDIITLLCDYESMISKSSDDRQIEAKVSCYSGSCSGIMTNTWRTNGKTTDQAAKNTTWWNCRNNQITRLTEIIHKLHISTGKPLISGSELFKRPADTADLAVNDNHKRMNEMRDESGGISISPKQHEYIIERADDCNINKRFGTACAMTEAGETENDVRSFKPQVTATRDEAKIINVKSDNSASNNLETNFRKKLGSSQEPEYIRNLKRKLDCPHSDERTRSFDKISNPDNNSGNATITGICDAARGAIKVVENDVSKVVYKSSRDDIVGIKSNNETGNNDVERVAAKVDTNRANNDSLIISENGENRKKEVDNVIVKVNVYKSADRQAYGGIGLQDIENPSGIAANSIVETVNFKVNDVDGDKNTVNPTANVIVKSSGKPVYIMANVDDGKKEVDTVKAKVLLNSGDKTVSVKADGGNEKKELENITSKVTVNNDDKTARIKTNGEDEKKELEKVTANVVASNENKTAGIKTIARDEKKELEHVTANIVANNDGQPVGIKTIARDEKKELENVTANIVANNDGKPVGMKTIARDEKKEIENVTSNIVANNDGRPVGIKANGEDEVKDVCNIMANVVVKNDDKTFGIKVNVEDEVKDVRNIMANVVVNNDDKPAGTEVNAGDEKQDVTGDDKSMEIITTRDEKEYMESSDRRQSCCYVVIDKDCGYNHNVDKKGRDDKDTQIDVNTMINNDSDSDYDRCDFDDSDPGWVLC